DLPGLLDPAYALQRSMRHLALEAISRADVVLHLHAAPDAPAPELASLVPDLPPLKVPVVVCYTKADLVPDQRRAELAATGAAVTSTEQPDSIAALIKRLGPLLPERPFRHDPDEIGTQPMRFFVAEFLREAAFTYLDEEVPYSI